MLHLTANNFDSEISASSGPVIIMFYANWCNKCAMMKPVAEEMEKNYRSQIKFGKVDTEEFPILAERYQIEIVPTFIFFENGQIEAAFSGIIDEQVFKARIKKIFRNC